MPGDIDRDAFMALLTERFPSITAEMDEGNRGMLYSEVQHLAKVVQAAISQEDTTLVREYFRFIDEVYRRGTPEMKNAIHVSFLECLSFDGKHGQRIKAREMLSSVLQAGLRGLEAYNEALFRTKKGK